MTSTKQNPERRKKNRIDEDERIWRGQLIWTFVVAVGVAVVAVQHVAKNQPQIQESTGPARFLSSTAQ